MPRTQQHEQLFEAIAGSKTMQIHRDSEPMSSNTKFHLRRTYAGPTPGLPDSAEPVEPTSQRHTLGEGESSVWPEQPQ